jgi:competence protein ComEC
LTLSDIRKYPSIFTVIPFTAGLLIAYLFPFVIPNPLLIILQIAAVILVILLYLKLLPSFSDRKLLAGYLLAVAICGGLRFIQCQNSSENRELDSLLSGSRGEQVVILGSVIEQPEITDDRIRVLIESDFIAATQNKFPIEAKILCTVYRNKFSESIPADLKFGDVVSIHGKLKNVPQKRNPGEFDYGRYLKIHGIEAVLTNYGFDNFKIIGDSKPGFYKGSIIYPVRNYCSNVIEKYIGGNEGEFLKGLVIGERSGITKQAKEDFINAGVAHIIAVSGLNVAYVLICVALLLTFVPIKYKFKIFILILLLVVYMNLTGNVPSIVRAVIMASVFLLSRLLERKPNPYSIISFAALVILVIDPAQLFDAGFILSFSAVISIVLIYPRQEKFVSRFINLEGTNIFATPLRAILSYLLVTLSAFIGLLPITAMMFERISLVSVVSNLVVVPLSNVALGVGFLLIIVSLFSAWLASIVASAASFILYSLLCFINYTAGFDLSYVETYGFDTLLFVSYYLLIYLIFTTNKINYKAKLALFVLLIANFFLFDAILTAKENLRLAYLDTGKSSSTLISNGEFNALIDAGASGINYTSAERTVIPYLRRQRIDKIDLLVVTDLNFSEYRNLIYLIVNFPVAEAILPSYSKSLFKNNFVKLVFKNTEVRFSDSNFSINDFRGISLNGREGLVECIYGKTKFVFSTGNKEAGQQTNILQTSGTGTFENYPPSFISHLNPAIVVTSHASGRSSRQCEVFKQTLRSVGINVIDLAESGAAIFESDGEKIWRVIWR